MELTRRDALAALAATGAVGAGALVSDSTPSTAADDEAAVDALETLAAVADVVYPSEVAGVAAFVEAYWRGRTNDRPDHAAAVADAAALLDEHARDWYGAAYADLDAAERDRLLRQTGTDTADPDPDGTVAERLRYYLVNELLYALYASPTGGALVGIENPQGHPGGTDSYRRGPTG